MRTKLSKRHFAPIHYPVIEIFSSTCCPPHSTIFPIFWNSQGFIFFPLAIDILVVSYLFAIASVVGGVQFLSGYGTANVHSIFVDHLL